MKPVKIVILIALIIALAGIFYWQFNALRERTTIEVIHTETTTNSITREIIHHSTASATAELWSTSPAEVRAQLAQQTGKTELLVTRIEPPTSPVRPTAAVSAHATSRGNEGVMTGRILLHGDRPKPKKIKTDADPKCAEMHADEPLVDESVIVAEDGAVRNVFVYVKAGLEGATFEKPAESVVIDQRGCRYEPHVFGMQVKQILVIRNGDDTLHNIHATPRDPANKEFNLGQPNKGMEAKKTFASPEVMVHFKCDVHPWMVAYAGVLDHPFFAVTGDDGVFALPPLPAGEYVIAAWHEVYGELTQPVTLGGRETKEISFTYTP